MIIHELLLCRYTLRQSCFGCSYCSNGRLMTTKLASHIFSIAACIFVFFNVHHMVAVTDAGCVWQLLRSLCDIVNPAGLDAPPSSWLIIPQHRGSQALVAIDTQLYLIDRDNQQVQVGSLLTCQCPGSSLRAGHQQKSLSVWLVVSQSK